VAHHLAILDRTGVAVSVLCAVHCAIAPVLLIALPTLGGIWVHPLAHLIIAALVLPVAGFALRGGFRLHRTRWVFAMGCVGIALVLLGAILPYLSGPVDGAAAGACVDQCCPSLVVDEATGTETLHIPPATIVTAIGGAALIAAHLANLRCCSRCRASAAITG